MLSSSDASSVREQYIEYGFLSDICKEMWQREYALDILHCHTDFSGYDVVLEANGIQRHVQLKSSHNSAKTASQKINVKLREKPSGCVIWIRFDEDTLNQTNYLWYGCENGGPLPDLGNAVVRHSKANTDGVKLERPGLRKLNKGAFNEVDSIGVLADMLFGKINPR